MPIARILVTAVSDEGDTVVVWGRDENEPEDDEPIGFAFAAKGEPPDIALAERASRLRSGDTAAIEYVSIADGWNIAGDLSTV